jgi:diguanylate cyclase (GGDEF)-like protein/PAS domain S-box-containing protein
MENKSIKILLVEDNPVDAELIKRMLLDKAAASQFELVAVERLGQALQRLHDEQFDVILLDLVLPDSQGLDTFSRIYAQASDVPIILLTGLDDEALAIQTVQAGAQDYLIKGQKECHLLVRAIRYAVERHQLHLELKASESRLRTIIENYADGIVVVNQAGIVQFINPSAEALLGRSIDELVGKPFDFPITTTEIQEFNIICRNDQPVTVEMHVVETAWAGEFAYLASLRDITDRKRVEEALHENERRLSTLMGNLPGMAYRCLNDEHWTMEFISEGCSNLTGYKTSDLIGNQRVAYNDLIHPDDRAPVWGQVQEALAERCSFRLVYRIRTVSGKEKWVWEQGEGVFSEKGEVLALEGFITDITERKQMEETLQDNLQQLEIAYEQATIYAQELIQEILERKLAEKALRDAHDELEIRVLERTMDLSRTNEALQNEIKDRQQVEAALRESEERYMLAAQGANDGLWDWDLQTNQVYFSLRWKSMLGYEENEIGNSPGEWFNRVHPEDLGEVKAAITAHREGRLPHLEYEYRMLHRDGTYRWMLSRGLAVWDGTGPAYRMAGSQTDITKRKRVEAKLVHDALYDPLTELPNRTFFIDKVRWAIRQAKEDENYLFAVLFLDLDRFKMVNDSLGHLVGDELLIAVAARLLMCLDNSDIIARLGGDEFAILLDGIKDINEVTQVANHIQKQMASPFEVSDQTVFTTVSIGIAPSTIGYDQPEECLRDADTAMYQAKANGRARYEIFSRDMHTSAMSLWQLDADLRQAVERQEFQIHYQPIVSLTTGQITGVEALLRWQHPQRGLLDPAEFIPLAEETGLIVSIGEWVLHKVCTQNKTWQEAGYSPLSAAVNLSARQFQHQDLPDLIKKTLHETGLTTQALVLEITESVATKNIDPGLATLHELNDMGIKISIDDFGIGSALDCLKRFPLNNLKIDQSFVKDVISDPANAAITRAIIDMAHSLNLTVIAEGVETEEQLVFLRSYQCDQIQGYLFSRPMPAEEFARLLQQGWRLTIDRNIRST